MKLNPLFQVLNGVSNLQLYLALVVVEQLGFIGSPQFFTRLAIRGTYYQEICYYIASINVPALTYKKKRNAMHVHPPPPFEKKNSVGFHTLYWCKLFPNCKNLLASWGFFLGLLLQEGSVWDPQGGLNTLSSYFCALPMVIPGYVPVKSYNLLPFIAVHIKCYMILNDNKWYSFNLFLTFLC